MIEIYKDFIEECTKDWNIKDEGICVLYSTLGLIEECWEISSCLQELPEHLREEIVLECGDAMWYLAVFCKFSEIDFVEACKKSQNIKNSKNVKEPIKELMKKVLFIQKRVNKWVFHRENIGLSVMDVCSVIVCITNISISVSKSGLENVLENNIAKLYRRYPHGRNATYVNKNLEMEIKNVKHDKHSN